MPYRIQQLFRKVRYLWWLWRIHYGWDITLNTDASATVILSSYNYKRMQNIEPIIRSVLRCRFIDKIIVTNNNPQIDIHNWVKIEDPRIQLINQPFRRPCGYRWILAKEEPGRYFLAIDDDLFLFPEQLRKLFYQLTQQPEVPHGLSGSIYKPPEAANLDQPQHSHFRQKEMEVDVLHEVYAVTTDHVKNYFEYSNKLKAHQGLSSDMFYSSGDSVTLADADDILISQGGMDRPRIHNFGGLLACPTAHEIGVAVWKKEDFTDKRLKILEAIKENQAPS